MSFYQQQIDGHSEFRVILVPPGSRMVLAEQRQGSLLLPRITIAKRTRPTEQLAERLLADWHIRSIVIDFLPESNTLPRCAIIEIFTQDWNFASDGFVAVPPDHFNASELTVSERLTVRHILEGNAADRSPFSRLGWIDEAREWIRGSVTDHRVEFDKDDLCSFASSPCALVRFGTILGPAYWLKAVGPDTHEFAVTQAVARYCSTFVPPLVATRADWNAWVTEESGRPLHEALELRAFEESTHCLAGLQITSACYASELLASGCFEQRMPTLRAHIPDLIRYLGSSMANQHSTKARPLDASRLLELGQLIERACTKIEAIGIPDSLLHNDINSGNILFDGHNVFFTDWAEAGIGCPFLTFQHLCVQASEVDDTHTWLPHLRQIYKGHWSKIIDRSHIDRALALCPPIAVASYICGRDLTFSSKARSSENAQSFARSLARYMDRFACSSEFLEALCD